MFIEIRDFCKNIKEDTVLSDINLELKSGYVYGLWGENGSGKTMLMRAICGLIYSTFGEIAIDGKVLGRDIDFPPSTGQLIENPSFLPNLSAKQNLKLLGSINGNDSDEIIKLYLGKVGLNPDSRKKYKKFSLGMKQKLGIAAALFEENELIILDEPYNALDEEGVELVNKLIYEAKERGAIVIISSHNRNMIDAVSDEVIRMNGGKIEK